MTISLLRALPIAILLGSASVSVSAQTRPDFSGEWISADSTTEQRSVATVGDGAFRVGNMGSGWGSPLTLRQQANRLVVEYAFFGSYDLQPRVTLTFALDGSESRNAVTLGHAESVLRSKIAWRGDTLVIATIYPAPTAAAVGETRHTLILTSPTSLIVETTRPAAAGAAPIVNRTTYTKR